MPDGDTRRWGWPPTSKELAFGIVAAISIVVFVFVFPPTSLKGVFPLLVLLTVVEIVRDRWGKKIAKWLRE